jgi:hypothetical protein
LFSLAHKEKDEHESADRFLEDSTRDLHLIVRKRLRQNCLGLEVRLKPDHQDAANEVAKELSDSVPDSSAFTKTVRVLAENVGQRNAGVEMTS